MTKARLREIRAAAKKCGEGWMPSFEAMVVELINEVQYLQEFTRAGKIPELPHKANELPLAAKVNLKKRARGSLVEMEGFAAEIGLPKSDGEYFFHKMIAQDWKINGREIKDWRAAVRQWKAGKYLPSQKTESVRKSTEAPGVTL